MDTSLLVLLRTAAKKFQREYYTKQCVRGDSTGPNNPQLSRCVKECSDVRALGLGASGSRENVTTSKHYAG